MFLSVKKLDEQEVNICFRTLSSRAVFALVGDALRQGKGLSIIRMGDGEAGLLGAPDGEPFKGFDHLDPKWNERLGIDGLEIEKIKAAILEAGNTCTYFAPSVSGVHRLDYKLHHHFKEREFYLDNFFVNDWTNDMIKKLLEASGGAFILHKEYTALIARFAAHYGLPESAFSGFAKQSWRDNDEAIQAAMRSGKQLVLFSAGPAGKLIGPRIAEQGRVVLDLGNTLPGWSVGDPRLSPREVLQRQ